jgi:hypothetical protein
MTECCEDWESVIAKLAELRLTIVEGFLLGKFRDPKYLKARHLISYPVTKHPVIGWGKVRIANQLKVKIRREKFAI